MRLWLVAAVLASGCTADTRELDRGPDDGGGAPAVLAADAASVVSSDDAGFLEPRWVSTSPIVYGEQRTCRELCATSGFFCAHPHPDRPFSGGAEIWCARPSFSYPFYYGCDQPLGVEIPGCRTRLDPLEANTCLCGVEAEAPTQYVPAPETPPALLLHSGVQVLPADALPGTGETCESLCAASNLTCLDFDESPARLIVLGPAAFGMIVDCLHDGEGVVAACDEAVPANPCPIRAGTAGCVCVPR